MRNHLFDGLFGAAKPDAIFAHMPDGRQFTYGDALGKSAQIAHALVGLGVTKGDRVAVQVQKSIEAALLYFACARIGAVFLPLNTAYTASEIDYFLGDAQPVLFVSNPDAGADIHNLAASNNAALATLGVASPENPLAGTLLKIAAGAQDTFENAECGAHDLAAILYTSGTTGRSKGAMLSHDNLLSNALALTDLWAFTEDDVLLHALPIFHTHGLFVAINIVSVSGGSLIFLPTFDVDRIVEELPRSTAMMGVPTFYTRLLSDDRFDRSLVDHMRLFVSGSAPLLAETHIQFEERTGKRILERYGMTETNMNTSNPYSGERRAGTVGFALPGTEVRIADADTGVVVVDGDVGVLEVSGPNVFKGYWNMPEKTQEEFRADGFFITGDLATKDDDGYIHIVGRAKDLIISGGYNIYPKEIELLLDDETDVLESAVIGVPHPDFGEAVVAVIVAHSSSFNVTATMDNVKSKLARFKQPKAYKVVDELPRNAMGKVQKNELRKDYADEFKA